MIDSVAGGVVKTMPIAIMKKGMMAIGYGVVTPRNESDTNAIVITDRTNVITRLEPRRSTIRAEIGAAIIIPSAYGIRRMPASRGVYPWTNCQYWVIKNSDPN